MSRKKSMSERVAIGSFLVSIGTIVSGLILTFIIYGQAGNCPGRQEGACNASLTMEAIAAKVIGYTGYVAIAVCMYAVLVIVVQKNKE